MNVFSALSLLAFMIYVLAGIYTLKIYNRNTVSILFMMLCVSFAVWSFCYAFVYVQKVDSGIWIKLSSLGWCSFSAIILHLALQFTKHPFSHMPVFLGALYLPAAFFCFMSCFLYWPGKQPPAIVTGIFNIGDFLYNFIYLLLAILLIAVWGIRSKNKRQKKRAKIVVVSSLVPFVLDLIIQTLLPAFGIKQFPPIGHLLSLIMIAGVFFASQKYGLFTISPEFLINKVLEEMMDVFFLTTPDGRILRVNSATEKLFGFSSDEMRNRQLVTFFKEKDKLLKVLNDSPEQGIHRYAELNGLKKSGSLVPINLSCSQIFDRSIDERMAILIVGQDVTTTKELEREIKVHQEVEDKLVQSEACFEAMFNQSFINMMLIDCQTLTVYAANEAAREFYGIREIENIKLSDILEISEKDVCKETRFIQKHKKCILHHKIRLKNGKLRALEIHASPVNIFNRNMIFTVLHDVTERKEAEERITFLAYHDDLTGLANRKLFYEQLERLINKAGDVPQKHAILYADLDGFKAINDTYGHKAGDYVLKTVGSRIKDCGKRYDLIARLGGDEFAVLLSFVENTEQVQQTADAIRENIQEPFEYQSRMLTIRASIGVGIFPDDGNTVDELINVADSKMYKIKKMNR